MGEYDALSGLSQKACETVYSPLSADGNGQGCGHNLLGAASFGAAVAIKRAIEAGELHGTVIFYGCPGEEGCAGKAFMARDGMFRELDAALTWHPGDTNEITVGSTAANMQIEYAFKGVSAHAASNPYDGRSALDAAELMHIGVNFLKEHIKPKESVHYSFSDAGGISPNVVQPAAKLIYMLRSDTVINAKKLLTRINNIAKGAALMTDTEVTITQLDGTADMLSNKVLECVLYDNLSAVGLPSYTEEELSFAKALKETYNCETLPGLQTYDIPDLKEFVIEKTENGTKPVNDFVFPYYTSDAFSPGSTDVGDVSRLTPTAQFTAVTWPSGSPGHSWQNVSCGKSSIAYKGMLLAAKVMAGACADLMENPEKLARARAEFEKTAADGYDCPIEKGVVPRAQKL